MNIMCRRLQITPANSFSYIFLWLLISSYLTTADLCSNFCEHNKALSSLDNREILKAV